MSDRDDIVFVERPLIECPACGVAWPLGKRKGPLRQAKGAKPQGDGSELTRWDCLKCGHRFTVVFEPANDEVFL